MTGIESTFWCDNCGVEILCGPIVIKNRYYCCRDCYLGWRCKCSERMEMDDERREAASSTVELTTG
jgi:hypothetical protein